MRQPPRRAIILAAAALLVLLLAGRAISVFYTDLLWYRAIGYPEVFWTRVTSGAIAISAATLIAATVVLLNLWFVARSLGPVRVRRRFGNLEFAEQIPRTLVYTGIVVASLLAGWWIASLKFGGGATFDLLAWYRREPWGVQDPLFHRDASFYVFTLPLLYRLADLATLALVWSFALSALGYVLVGTIRMNTGKLEIDPRPRTHFLLIVAGIVLVLGLRYWIGQYALAVQGSGFAGSVGYTDVQARLPAQRIMTVLAFVAVGALLLAARRGTWLPASAAVLLMLAGSLVVGQLYPSLVQRFRVEPNQLARERSYLKWNMEFTRRAYGVDSVHRAPFPYREEGVPSNAIVAPRLAQLPLWDSDQLKIVFDQVQAIAGYYNFPDVDIDRYGAAGDRKQVAVSVREFYADGLPQEKRTWQNLKLQYIHASGAVAVPTAQATSLGQPVPWLQNIDPVQTAPQAPAALALTEPKIYFAETMHDYAIAQGDSGAAGPQGVELSSLLRRLAFAWRFADKNLLLSSEVRPNSRVIHNRAVRERVTSIAPFMTWGPDPESVYPVMSNGHVVWIVEGYTATAAYPFARATRLPEIGTLRYLRNSAKAVVDGVTGAVTIYVTDATDPLVRTYARVFPRVFRDVATLPAGIREHFRYPPLMLRVQADILEEYHIASADAFYAGQDVWQLPHSSGQAAEATYRPMFVEMPLPDSTRPEFLLQIPFIARNRQNMTALLAARSDGQNYGQLFLYELPRDVQVPGPSQVEAVMEQDPVISPQLSLWRQAGSTVNLGDLRLVPLARSFLYVRPVFLLAQGRPIPELERVIVSDGRATAMAATLAGALDALRGSGGPDSAPDSAAAPPRPGAQPSGLSQRALQLLDQAEQHLRRGEWAAFGARLAELRTLLRSGAAAPAGTP
jgi:uncharacterized protein